MRTMKKMLVTGFAASTLALAGCATAQQPGVSDQDHQAHHPAGAATTVTPAPAQGAGQSGTIQGMGQGGMGMMGGQGQGMMGQGMMGSQGQGMMGGGQGGQGMMDMCPMMAGAKSPEEHRAMFQQRLKNMPPDQVRQMMSMMESHMSMMQGDMQMMRDQLAKQPK